MGKLSRFTSLARVLWVACALASTASFADKSVDDAKTRFKRGADYYDEGNFRAALIEFERAYQLLPNYKILYNIGQVRLQLLEYARAQEAFSRYLKEGGSDVNASRREEVNRELDRLKTRVGRIAVSTTDGAEVLLDDESIGTAPLPGPVVANTGRHKVTVVVPGKAAESRVVEVAGLETSTVSLGKEEVSARVASAPTSTASQVPAAAVVATRAAPPAPRSKTPLIIGWVATGALAITGGVFAGLAFGEESALQKIKGSLNATTAGLSTSAAKVGSLSLTADLFGLAAIVAGGVSLFLTVNFLSSDDVAVSIGPGGVSVFARF